MTTSGIDAIVRGAQREVITRLGTDRAFSMIAIGMIGKAHLRKIDWTTLGFGVRRRR
jgi:hypothetical protein